MTNWIGAQEVPCPRCGARINEPCRSAAGKKSPYYHTKRLDNASKLDVIDQIDTYNGETEINAEISDLADEICPTMIEGWLWVCGIHDSHGASENEIETRFMAGLHHMFHSAFLEPCNMLVWQRIKHERLSGTIDLSKE